MSGTIEKLLEERDFLANAGTETYLVFQQGFELPEFCAFAVFDDPEAWATLERDYLRPVLRTAAEAGRGLMLDALVWRAQPDYVARVAGADRLVEINARAIEWTRAAVDRFRRETGHGEEDFPVLVVADIGPRGDGYRIEGETLSIEEARAYHAPQIAAVADAGADLVGAFTMTSLPESIGIALAARDHGLPVIVSPTVETDGRLPDGSSLGHFVEAADEATDHAPLFYMVNCAHPSHVTPALEAARREAAPWLARFRGFRANASAKSHAELDESTELDRGDVAELARQVAELRETFGLKVVGGCCGTDHEHLAAMAKATASPAAR